MCQFMAQSEAEQGPSIRINDPAFLNNASPNYCQFQHPEVIVENESLIQLSSHKKPKEIESQFPYTDISMLNFKGSSASLGGQKSNRSSEKYPKPFNSQNIESGPESTPLTGQHLLSQESMPPLKRSKLSNDTHLVEAINRGDSINSTPEGNMPDRYFNQVFSFSQSDNKPFTTPERIEASPEEEMEPTSEDFLTFPELMNAIMNGFITWDDLRFREDVVRGALERIKNKANRLSGR